VNRDPFNKPDEREISRYLSALELTLQHQELSQRDVAEMMGDVTTWPPNMPAALAARPVPGVSLETYRSAVVRMQAAEARATTLLKEVEKRNERLMARDKVIRDNHALMVKLCDRVSHWQQTAWLMFGIWLLTLALWAVTA
jgi:hypothetical protein